MINFDIKEYLTELEKLVNIDSGSRVLGGTDKIADYFTAKYRELGLDIKIHIVNPNLGPCLEIRNRPECSNIDVMLVGHMDTVFPEGTVAERPYSTDGDNAYGAGVIDMKAGLLSIYYIVKELLLKQVDLNFCIAMNSDEEISSISSQEWLKGLARKSQYAFVMEPARKNGACVMERKGLARYSMKINGISAHAGVAPQDGASAIHEMANIITNLVSLNNYAIGTSLNVGKISGGTTANVVCDYAQCDIDTRFDSIEECYKIEEQLKFVEKNPKDSRTIISIIREGFRPPMRKTVKTDTLIERMNYHGKTYGVDMKWVKTGGGSDGNFIAFEGCTVVDGVGPVGDGTHSKNEVLNINTVEARINIVYDTIVEIVSK